MKFVLYLSDYMIPIVIFYIIGFGLLMKTNVLESFLKGVKEGFEVVLDIAPTLIALMVGVGVLRASGALDFATALLSPITSLLHFPSQLVPLALMKMVSSSAATGLLLDLFKEFGADSQIGRIASVMMSSTETVFYTMSVYFVAAKVKKTRYTLVGALAATVAGIAASVVLAGL